MFSKLKSFGLCGLEGFLVDVEVDINYGLPSFDIVGLGDTAIKESKFRVKSAIRNCFYQFPIDKITINLAPADMKKEGAMFDLAIAVGLLKSSNQIQFDKLNEYIILGELSLDGCVKKINGILPIIITARNLGYKKFIIPKFNQNEARFISDVEIIAVDTLTEVVNFLNCQLDIEPTLHKEYEEIVTRTQIVNDFKYIKGQRIAKRALEIAAAGGHNCLMIGPPGSGKSMLAKAFPSILPSLTFEEALEVTKIHSVAGILDSDIGIVSQRPFRCPHHTTTTVALCGGGRNSKPGEISLAHNGVLFLDEFPEYQRTAIETLRQPLEDCKITVARLQQSVEYPANIMLIGSMNPCPCGYYGDSSNKCKCSESSIVKYRNKLSGPILDRIDLHVEVDNIKFEDLKDSNYEESSATIKERVELARKIQLERFKNDNIFSNAKMDNEQILKYCQLTKDCEEMMKSAFERFNLSARAYNRILKVARTIADLEACENINELHLYEAINFRVLDKKYGI